MTKVTRRGFLKGATAAVGTAPLLGHAALATPGGAAALEEGQRAALTLDVNGHPLRIEVDPLATLAEALREGAGLTGTKVSCEGGACGACTVLIDGKPAPSCLALAIDLEGRAIRTVEGFATDGQLHPVQQAFIDADALQCGYCTPGFVTAAVAFFERWRQAHGTARPPREEVAEALSGNLCRCGAQPALLAAVQAACAGEKARPLAPRGDDKGGIVRLDAREKVTGEAPYTFDLYPRGVLHTFVLRAPVGHAKVRSIDLGPAEAAPGVRAACVLLPKTSSGYATLRYVGQEIAAVAAETYREARAAAAKIALDLEKLPPAVDPAFAEREDAPLVYAAPKDQKVKQASEGPAGVPEALMQWRGNVRGPMVWPLDGGTGEDARRAVEASDVKVSFEVETAVQNHVPLERHVCLAEWQGDALVMHASTQTTQILASDLADALELPKAKVQVKAAYVGGGFGCKAGLRPEHLAAALLARQAGRPVRVALRFDEHMTNGGNRPGTRQALSLGAREDGRLLAVTHEAKSFCGAAVGERATGLTDVHYPFEDKYCVDRNVVTHTPPACPFRAPGFPPNAFALEQAVDEVAARLGKDPLGLRIAHDPNRRRRLTYELALAKAGYDEGKLAEAQATPLTERGRYALGVGVATAEWFVLSAPNCKVELRAFKDGTLEVATATHDMGQGTRTVLASVVEQRLGVRPDKLRVRVGDSALATAPGSFGSITTNSIAHAAADASDQLLRTLVPRAGARFAGARLERGGLVLPDPDGRRVPFGELFELLPDEPFVVLGARGDDRDGFRLPPVHLGDTLAEALPIAVSHDIATSAQIAEVEVDRWLGRVRVRRVVMAIDAGRIVSRVTARSQCIGAVMQGVSYALYEERRLDPRDGRQLTRSLDHYGILGIADAPDVEVHFLDVPSPHTPEGCFGLGENSIVATSAAVANAVFRATGKRLQTTPMTPGRVLAALGA